MVCPWTEDTETHHCPISSPSLNISEKSDLDTWTGYKADGVCVCMSKLTDISYTVIEGANHLIRKPYRAYVSGIFFSPSNLRGCLYQVRSSALSNSSVTLFRLERSIKQHGYCKEECSYFERSSADSWCVQVNFLKKSCTAVRFCDKQLFLHELLDLCFFLNFEGIL